MRKFKIVFYSIYIITVIFVVIVSLNVYESLELFKKWGWFRYFSDLPFIGRNLILFLSTLMIIEFITENIVIYTMRKKALSTQDEILRLKAKLFDQAEEEVIEPDLEAPETPEPLEPTESTEEDD